MHIYACTTLIMLEEYLSKKIASLNIEIEELRDELEWSEFVNQQNDKLKETLKQKLNELAEKEYLYSLLKKATQGLN